MRQALSQEVFTAVTDQEHLSLSVHSRSNNRLSSSSFKKRVKSKANVQRTDLDALFHIWWFLPLLWGTGAVRSLPQKLEWGLFLPPTVLLGFMPFPTSPPT